MAQDDRASRMLRRSALMLAIIGGAALISVLILARPKHEKPDVPTQIATSLAEAARSAGPVVGTCRQGPSRWRCSVADSSGSGSAVYAVRLSGACWKARLVDVHSVDRLPRHVSGCAK